MARKQMTMSGLPEGFALTEKTIAHVTERYPTVDIDKTLERFIENCEARGTMYADWQAGFRTWVRMNVEEKWKGVVYKQGKIQDPAWMNVLKEARQYGFREPVFPETPASFRVALERWKDRPKHHDSDRKEGALEVRNPVIDFGNVLKKA